jgi:hypothetical protein
MSVWVAHHAEIAYRRTIVERIAAQAAVRFGTSRKFINGCSARQGNAQVGEWSERMFDRARRLCEDENERSRSIGKPYDSPSRVLHVKPIVNNVHAGIASIKRDRSLNIVRRQRDVRPSEIGAICQAIHRSQFYYKVS